VDPDSLPDCLEVTAKTEDGLIMGLRHKTRQWDSEKYGKGGSVRKKNKYFKGN